MKLEQAVKEDRMVLPGTYHCVQYRLKPVEDYGRQVCHVLRYFYGLKVDFPKQNKTNKPKRIGCADRAVCVKVDVPHKPVTKNKTQQNLN